VAAAEVQQCYRVGSGPDFVLILFVPDVAAYHAFATGADGAGQRALRAQLLRREAQQVRADDPAVAARAATRLPQTRARRGMRGRDQQHGCSATSERRARRGRRQVRQVLDQDRLEKLLVKAASWSRRPTATGALQEHTRPAMHEAAFELIEIPHVRQSGKNSADIRMVSTRSTSATPSRTSTPSSSSVATPTSSPWCRSCARTTSA